MQLFTRSFKIPPVQSQALIIVSLEVNYNNYLVKLNLQEEAARAHTYLQVTPSSIKCEEPFHHAWNFSIINIAQASSFLKCWSHFTVDSIKRKAALTIQQQVVRLFQVLQRLAFALQLHTLFFIVENVSHTRSVWLLRSTFLCIIVSVDSAIFSSSLSS